MVALKHLLERDLLASVRGHAAHRRHQAGFDAAFDFVVWLVFADRLDEVVPFELVEIGGGWRKSPHLIFTLQVVTLENPPCPSNGVAPKRDCRHTLRSMHDAGEF